MVSDRYELLEIVFEAGPSTFYRARSVVLGNELLIRRLSIDPTRAEDVHETFYREMRHAAQLAHPRIQRPIDVMDSEGHLWSVHEYTIGRSTAAAIAEDGPMPVPRAARTGAQVADALAHLHSRGFLHGKVRPQVVAIDHWGESQLLNLVKSADLAAGIWPLRPAVLGLSPFSAPEEFRGERPTPATDLHSLAASIIFWITGRYPRGGGDEEEALALAAEAAPPLDLGETRAAVPKTLTKALHAAMRNDPRKRKGTVASLGSLLMEHWQRTAAEIPSGFGPGATLHPRGQVASVEIERRHGAGAFGVVMRAKDTTTGTAYAVKALKPEHRDDRDAHERFLREARAMQAIEHPNVVRILGVGEELQTPYAVMEFIPGSDLATVLLREGYLAPERAARIAEGIARGLHAIHEAGIVHRDIKPHNVLLADEERPVIADFGVARDSGQTRMTMTGRLVGTPAYMAPEIFEAGEITGAADLFALGTMLYEMITGGVPFKATDTIETIRAIREQNPEDLGDEVPAAIREVVTRLLAKQPGDRYTSAAEAAEALALASAPQV